MKNIFLLVSTILLFSCASKTTVPDLSPPEIDMYTHMAATPIAVVNPKYPRKAARKRIEGWVYFEFELTQEGVPKNIKVVKSFPDDMFDESAIDAIKQWRFKVIPKSTNYNYLLEFKHR